MTYAPGTGRAFGGTARKRAGTPACVHASKYAVCVRGKNRRPSVTRRHHRACHRTLATTRDPTQIVAKRASITRTCGTSRRIASSKASPSNPSSQTWPPWRPCSPFRLRHARKTRHPIVSRKALARVGAGESTTTSRDARAPPIAPPVRAAKNTRARAFYTYPSSSAPSSSIVVVRRKRPSAPRAHPTSSSRARPETSRARSPHHRFIFDTHHIGVDVCRMRMTHQPWCA